MSSFKSASTSDKVNVADWNPNSISYPKPPKISKQGGATIELVYPGNKRWLKVQTPSMMTWGISDYTDDEGVSNNRFSISLNFPNNDYKTPECDMFLDKFKAFEEQVKNDAVINSELWFGKKRSRDGLEESFFSSLKYSKMKDSKKPDLSKPPSIKPKVACYDGKWEVEIYDTKCNLLFPAEEGSDLTPMDFVPKLSQVVCLIQCGGVWIVGSSWGIIWKLKQVVVKRSESLAPPPGKCQIELSTDERVVLEQQEDEPVDDDLPIAVNKSVPTPVVKPSLSVEVDDSDNEGDAPLVEAPVAAPMPAQETVPVKKVVKKIVKKVAT